MYLNPTVVSVTPKTGAVNVPVDTEISVLFSAPMATQDMPGIERIDDPDNFYVIVEDSGERLTGAITVRDLNTAVFTPDSQLEHGKTYKIVVDGDVMDIYGTKMFIPLESTFTTVEAAQEPDDGQEETPDEVPFVVSSYPKDSSFGITPDTIKIKLSSTINVDGIHVGSNFYVVDTKFDEEDLDDLDLIGLTSLAGTVSVDGNILTFTPDSPLANDTTYSVIMKDFVQNAIITFQSKPSMLFGDIDMIRADLALAFANIPDDILLKYMMDASILARETAVDETIDWTNPPNYVHQYVRYKTQYDLVSRKHLELTVSSTLKTLGDLTIQNMTSPTEISTLLKDIKRELKKWEDALNGRFRRGYARPVAVNRRTNTEYAGEYPEWIDRRFKDIEGEKE